MIRTILWIIAAICGYFAVVLLIARFLALSSEDWDRINKEYHDDTL